MKVEFRKAFLTGMRIVAVVFSLTLLMGSFSRVAAADKSEAQGLVDNARVSFTNMMSDSNFYWLQKYIKDAKGVLIFPQVLKGGFFLGGSGGTGVLLVRNGTSDIWSDPAFYTVGSVTFGLQIGAEAAEVVMLAMNQKALDTLLISTAKLGADVSIAVGPVGGGAKGSVAVPAVSADFISFARSKGLYAGLNLEGSVLAVRDSLNEAYYGKGVGPKDILIKLDVRNSGAKALRAAVQKAAKR
ncbi:MAG: lipid-binding SYLF domain-containing protein [Geobacteraceae bacterium]